MEKIKIDAQEKGDLGLVAEVSTIQSFFPINKSFYKNVLVLLPRTKDKGTTL